MSERLRMRTIDCRSGNAAAELQALRRQLSPQGNVVSERGRQRTIEVFGAPLTPRAVVERICTDVAERGLPAVLEYSRKLDRAELDEATLRVSEDELFEAHRQADPKYLATIRYIRQNIMAFQNGILHRDAVMQMGDHELRLVYRPLHRVGVCVPGGAAAYPSTLLMTAVPAQSAGVDEIAVVAPPTPFGANNPDLLAACWEIGVKEVYRVGGAQAVAALAFGAGPLQPVDKIVGPGNLFVALAKQFVSGQVGIDMIAGPTELVVLADASANPRYVAADLISQAEHSPGASILITWHAPLVDAVAASLEQQLGEVDRGGLARESLESYGAFVSAADEAEACRISDQIAPEHLQIQTAVPNATLQRVRHAGAVFLGAYTPVAVGDYVAGPSHTLPTGGTARFASGLCSNDFLKRMSVIRYSAAQLAKVADHLRLIAAKEGLTAHSHSVDVRLASCESRESPKSQ